MSICETIEEGKEIVSQTNNGTAQKLSSWSGYEEKNISELLASTQVFIGLFMLILTFVLGTTYIYFI